MKNRGRFAFLLMTILWSNWSAGAARAGDYVYTAGSFDKVQGGPERNYDWHNRLNWEPEGIPGAGDGATVPADKSVFMGSDVSVARLDLQGNIYGGGAGTNLTVAERFDFSRGGLGPNNLNSVTIGAGCQWNITGDGGKSISAASIRTLGQTNWSGKGNLNVGGSVWDNPGTLLITGDAYFGFVDFRAAPTFNNTGTVIKRNSTGISSFGSFDPVTTNSYRCIFNNSGIVSVESGTFRPNGGLSTGTYNVSEGAKLSIFEPGEMNGATFLGAGKVEINTQDRGTPIFRGDIASATPFEMVAGSVSFDNVTLSGGGRFVHRGGQLSGALTIAPDSAYEFAGGTAVLNSVTLTNRGNMVWSSGNVAGSNAILDNAAGGVFRAQSTGVFYPQSGSFNLSNAGTFFAGSLGTTVLQLSAFSNSGTVEAKSGDLVFTGFSYTQASGTTRLAGGVLSTNNFGEGSIFMRINDGVLSGTGTINSRVQVAGTLRPGTDTLPGIIAINGDYVQTATGTLSVKLGGLDAQAPQFDQLKVSGNAALNGTLTVNTLGFTPVRGQTFSVLTHGSRGGTFSSVTGKASGLSPVYNASDVQLTIPNRAPVVSAVTINPATPNTRSKVKANVAGGDPDGDAVTYSYSWSKTVGTTTTPLSETSNTLDLGVAGNGDRGEIINVSVVARDAELSSAPRTASTNPVVNSAPIITLVTLNNSAPKTNSIIKATVTAGDVDGDGLTYSYVWTRDDIVIPGATTDTLDLSKPGHGDVGQTLTVIVIASDGALSSRKASARAKVVNTYPTISIGLTPASPTTKTLLTATALITDVDNTRPTVTFQWSVIRGGQTVLKQTNIGKATSATYNLAQTGFGNKGDTVKVVVTVRDIDTDFVKTAGVKVQNSAPTLQRVTLSPSSPNTSTLLRASVSATDDDGDALTYSYVWRQGVNRPRIIAGQNGPTLDLATPGFGDAGDTISVSVSASDGALTSNMLQTSVRVSASAPASVEPSAGNS